MALTGPSAGARLRPVQRLSADPVQDSQKARPERHWTPVQSDCRGAGRRPSKAPTVGRWHRPSKVGRLPRFCAEMAPNNAVFAKRCSKGGPKVVQTCKLETVQLGAPFSLFRRETAVASSPRTVQSRGRAPRGRYRTVLGGASEKGPFQGPSSDSHCLQVSGMSHTNRLRRTERGRTGQRDGPRDGPKGRSKGTPRARRGPSRRSVGRARECIGRRKGRRPRRISAPLREAISGAVEESPRRPSPGRFWPRPGGRPRSICRIRTLPNTDRIRSSRIVGRSRSRLRPLKRGAVLERPSPPCWGRQRGRHADRHTDRHTDRLGPVEEVRGRLHLGPSWRRSRRRPVSAACAALPPRTRAQRPPQRRGPCDTGPSTPVPRIRAPGVPATLFVRRELGDKARLTSCLRQGPCHELPPTRKRVARDPWPIKEPPTQCPRGPL
ncbi:hypothetical protein M885DRAFT_289541 [Pelagophyceae sp. CCMP2097]|nr:hypothetical protein M885DRAFT_289541 [Pelagophyceae sp. CCMP2097]